MASEAVALAPTRSVFEAIFRLKREHVDGILVEYNEIAADPERALATLRAAAGKKRVLVLMTAEEAESHRARALFHPDEILVCPFFPNELWKRLRRHRAVTEQSAISRFGSDADRLAALMEDARLLNRWTSNLRRLTQTYVDRVRSRVGAGKVTLFLRKPNDAEMGIAASVGLDAEVAKGARCTPGKGIAGRILAQRRAILVRAAGEDGPASRRSYSHDSYMIVPQLWQDEVLGVLCVTDHIHAGPFRDRDLAYLEALAESAAPTLHNALLLQTADELATIDELTGLFNRRYFNRALHQEVERARRYHHDLTVAMLDVDNFKLYNDTNGHQAGDQALQTIALILKESFRESDIVIRYGGEEFVVIMPETTRLPGNGVDFVDRARRRVEEADIRFNAPGAPHRLTISGGVASFPSQAKNAQELVRRADEAQYEAKREGRNMIVGA